MSDDDPFELLNRLQAQADRFRLIADGAPDPAPKIVKRRPYVSPSGAQARNSGVKPIPNRGGQSKRGQR